MNERKEALVAGGSALSTPTLPVLYAQTVELSTGNGGALGSSNSSARAK